MIFLIFRSGLKAVARTNDALRRMNTAVWEAALGPLMWAVFNRKILRRFAVHFNTCTQQHPRILSYNKKH